MFDIYDFINSVDVGNYLKSINHQFNSLEMAWIINNCHKQDVTINQKQAAFIDIINNTTDCEIKQRLNCKYRKSLHIFLNQYIALENKVINDFFCNNQAVYMYKSFSCKYQEWLEDYSHAFASFDLAYTDAKVDSQNDEISIVRVKKQSLLNPKECIILDFNINKQILRINDVNNLTDEEMDLFYCSFDGMWFAFPVPFQKGDVVVLDNSDGIDRSASESLCSGPFVLLGTTSTTENKFIIEKGDNTDMTGYGYFQNEEGDVYYECMFNYFDLEYYNGEFTGKRRILKALSNCIKGEISEQLFARAYHYILMDEYVKSIKPQDITEDAMELLGLK